MRRVDPGDGAEQRHDFDLELAAGDVIAVEVTRHNLPANLAVLAELDKRDWHFPSLDGVWIVDMIPDYGVGALHSEISDLLYQLESVGIDQIVLRSDLFDESLTDDELDAEDSQCRGMLRHTATRATASRLHELGARLAYRIDDAERDGGQVFMCEASEAGTTGPSLVVELVENHAGRDDNIAKLEAARDRFNATCSSGLSTRSMLRLRPSLSQRSFPRARTFGSERRHSPPASTSPGP